MMKFDNPSRKFNEYFAINQLHNSENTVPNLTDMTDGRNVKIGRILNEFAKNIVQK